MLTRPFILSVGPNVPISPDPTELFLQLFTPELVEEIVTETNRYAALCLSTAHNGEGPVPHWETYGDELKAYFGFSILMGMNRLPDLYDYWSVDKVFQWHPGSRGSDFSRYNATFTLPTMTPLCNGEVQGSIKPQAISPKEAYKT